MPPLPAVAVKRLFEVVVEVSFETTTTKVLVWAADEEEARSVVEEDDIDSIEPDGVESIDVEDAEEVATAEVESLRAKAEKGWHVRVVGEGFSWDAALEASREEERALECWKAQGVLPGFPGPPLPSRCDECGARPPLSPHAADCSTGNIEGPDLART